MNNWKLRHSFTGNATSDVQTVNGYLASGEDNDFAVTVVPDGKEYAAPLFIPRTNLVLQSNQFDTTWSKTNVSVTSGQAGYDGTSDAWKIEGTGSSVFSYLDQADTTAHVKTKSIYAKAGSVDWISIWSASSNKAYFDLANGTTGVLAGPYVIDSSITSIGGGWYRCEVAMTESAQVFYIIPATSDNGTSLSAGDYVYIQDAQLEAGSVATEYIPTTTAAVTRDWSAFGRVQNQLPGICNGTHTHTGAASGSGIAATTITGSGSGATFAYEFDTLGVLTTLTADGAGSGYKVGDKLSIDTTEGHTIEFRLVEGSNAATVSVSMGAAKPNKPIPFPVSKMRVEGLTDRTVLFLDRRSQYVFPKPTPYLLDTYEGAAAAYSLRRLRSAYTGPAVRVRRASNNDELDIYFNRDGSLDTATLEAFCAGTDGFVKVWYDQGQEGNDATQGATGAQPQIVDTGTVITNDDNGLPALQGVTNNYFNLSSAIIGSGDFSIYTASTRKSSDMLYGGNSPRFGIWAHTSNGLRSRFANPNTEITFTGTLPDDALFLSYFNRSGNDAEMAANGATAATDTLVSSNDFTIQYLLVGNGTVSFNYEGQAFEFVFYDSDQSSNREGIEDNINEHYGIYP